MKMVRFNRAMAPYLMGEKRVLTDEMAAALVANGTGEIVPSVFDPPGGSHTQGVVQTPDAGQTPGVGQSYQTRQVRPRSRGRKKR